MFSLLRIILPEPPISNPLTKLNPPSLPDAESMGYSQVVVCDPGKTVFMSGQVAWQSDETPVPGDLASQAHLVMKNVMVGLQSVGAGPENIASMRIYIVDAKPTDFELIAPVLSEFLQGEKPAVTGLGVQSLTGPDLKIEIEVMAMLYD